MSIRHFGPGQVLLRQGDPGGCVLFIRSGQVEVLRDGAGESVPLAVVGEFAYLGQMGVLERRARSATVRAVSSVEAEVIDGRDFLERLRTHATLGQRLVLRLSARLRDVEAMLDALHAGPPPPTGDNPPAPLTLRAASVAVRDLDRQRGTLGDAVPIARDLGSDSFALVAGEHRILPGGYRSPYAFTLSRAMG